MFGIPFLELALQISAAMLVFAETIQLTLVVLEREIGKTIKLARVAFSLATLSNSAPTI
jgi:hypothetical protein